MHLRLRPRFRRLALALATAQMATYAILPYAEARLERPNGPAALEQQHSHDCAPLHNPATCLFCQAAVSRAQPGRAADVPVPALVTGGVEGVLGVAHDGRAPPHTPPSRAPPAILA